jgi:uncharacterized protein
MAEFLQQLPQLAEFLKVHMEKAGCSAHDLDHCYRVANMATRLANEDGICSAEELQIIFFAGLLHDVFDSKLYAVNELQTVEETIREMLKTAQFADNIIQDIFTTINNVGYKNLLIPDRDVSSLPKIYFYVQDSDLLDAIGMIGVSRCMAYSGRLNRTLFSSPALIPTTEKETCQIGRDEYLASRKNPEQTATDHFREKLLRIKSLMLTTPGSRLAERRQQNMLQYLQLLKEEINECYFIDNPTL